MVLTGECMYSYDTDCDDCGKDLSIDVLQSAAGFYIGFFCPECGPYSRESGYYESAQDAQQALDEGGFWR